MSMSRWKGVTKERLLQLGSLTTQATILLRVSSFKLRQRNRQEARRNKGGGRADPHPWHWGGAWIELGFRSRKD